MSSTSFPASADSPSALSEREDSEPLRSAKSTPTAAPSSQSTGLEYPSMRTLEPSQEPPQGQQTLFAEDSHAKISAWQGRAQASKVRAADYGQSMPVLLTRYDPDTSLWKTSQLCLEGGLESFSETWPRSGMTRSGTAYRLETLAHPTSAIGSGLLPTPAARDWKDGGYPAEFGRKSPSMVARVLLPTPRKSRGYTAYNTEARAPALIEILLGQRGSATNGWKMNPSFVEWMMGFPIGWGVLVRAETPSSRKSRKSSGERSSKPKDGHRD